MYQKDYILRMIEMFGEFMQALFGMIRKGQYKKASLAIENAYTELLQKNSAEILHIPSEALVTTLQHEHRFNEQQIEIVAGLLYAEAELLLRQKHLSESRENYQKSLLIYEFLDETQKTYSQERQETLETLRKRISEMN